jgi:hypothetical protein
MGSIIGDRFSNHAKAIWMGLTSRAFAIRLQQPARHAPCPQREPRDERDPTALAIVHDIVPFAIGEAVPVLDRTRSARSSAPGRCAPLVTLDSPTRRIFPSESHVRQGFNRGVERHHRIGHVQLVDVDAVEAQSLQAAFHRLAQVRRAGIVRPLVRPRAIPSPLRRDDQVVRGKARALRRSTLR